MQVNEAERKTTTKQHVLSLTADWLLNLIGIEEVAEEGVRHPSAVEEACHQPDDQVAAAHHSFPQVEEA